MPRYDIKCIHCGNIWETSLSMTEDKHNVECPKCGSKNSQNYLGNTQMRVIFKGPGFYTNDNALKAVGAPPAVIENAYKKKVL